MIPAPEYLQSSSNMFDSSETPASLLLALPPTPSPSVPLTAELTSVLPSPTLVQMSTSTPLVFRFSAPVSSPTPTLPPSAELAWVSSIFCRYPQFILTIFHSFPPRCWSRCLPHVLPGCHRPQPGRPTHQEPRRAEWCQGPQQRPGHHRPHCQQRQHIESNSVLSLYGGFGSKQKDTKAHRERGNMSTHEEQRKD